MDEQRRAQAAEAALAQEREARARAEAEVERLRKKLNRDEEPSEYSGQWLVSDSQDVWLLDPERTFGTRDEAIEYALNHAPQPSYVGRLQCYRAGDFVTSGNTYLLLEQLAEAAGDEGVESPEPWPPKFIRQDIEELTARLKAVVDQWFDEKQEQPTFFAVRDIDLAVPF